VGPDGILDGIPRGIVNPASRPAQTILLGCSLLCGHAERHPTLLRAGTKRPLLPKHRFVWLWLRCCAVHRRRVLSGRSWCKKSLGASKIREEKYLQRSFDVIVEKDAEGYYVASVPSLPGCHTQSKSLDELDSRIREAIELCLEEEDFPERDLEFVGIQRVVIAA
jgi:predicted RNase H-like HicB family nuclease